MKNLRYFIFMLISLVAVSCVEENVNPSDGPGDDDPIGQGGTGGGSGSGGGGSGGSGGGGTP